MARNAGLEVFATASAKDLDYVRELGAGTAIDYRETPFEQIFPAHFGERRTISES